MAVVRRVVAAAGLALVGVVTGLAAAVSHELWWSLPLTTAGLGAAYLAVGPGWSTRVPLALGFTAAVGWALRARPEGDYLVSASTRGLLLVGVVVLALVVAVATLPRPGRRGVVAGPTGVGESGGTGATT